jgi:hypothetical protein
MINSTSTASQDTKRVHIGFGGLDEQGKVAKAAIV